MKTITTKKQRIYGRVLAVAALLLATSANAQNRNTGGTIQNTKVDLSCTASKTSDNNVHLVATNRTASALPQGTTIYFKGEGMKNIGLGVIGTYFVPYPLTEGKMVLGVLIPSGTQFSLKDQSTGLSAPFTCTAWYFK